MKSAILHGSRYRVGDRLWRLNSFDQQFNGEIVAIAKTSAGKVLLMVKRDDWPSPEAVDLDDCVRSMHFPKAKAAV